MPARLRHRTLSIRATLVAIAAVIAVYLGSIGLFVVIDLTPSASRMETRTSALNAEFSELRARQDELRGMLRESRALGGKDALTPVDHARLGVLAGELRALADNSASVQAGLRVTGVSVVMRGLLADAAAAESRFAATLGEAIGYLDSGDLAASSHRFETAIKAHEAMADAIDSAQRIAFRDMIDRERELGVQAGQAVRSVGGWALAGIVLLTGLTLLIRRRLYVPLAVLDSGLARVAHGDLQTSLPVQRDDEFGRLTAQFNQMTEWLRIRASEDRTRETHLAERGEKIGVAALEIAQIALVAPTIGEMFAQIHQVIAGLMPARNFYLALYDEQTDLISFPYFVDEEDQDTAPAPKRPGRGCTEYVLRTGQPLLLNPALFEELAARGEVVLIGPASADWLGVPLFAAGKVIGVLVVQSYGDNPRHTEADLGMLQFVSTQVGMAVMRRRAENALADSRTQLQGILDAAPFGAHYYELREDGSLVFSGANKSADRVLGVANAQFVGKTIEENFPALASTDIPDHYRRAAADGIPFDIDQVGYDAEGVRGAFEVHAIQTTPGHMAAFFRDITEAMRLQQNLRRSEERYRALVDGARDMIFALAPDGTVTTLNPAFEEMTGLARSEWLGKPFVDLLHTDDGPAVLAHLQSPGLADRGAAQAIQLRVRTRDGAFRIGELHTNVLRRDHEVVGVLGVVRDVTDRVHLEEQVRHAQKMESIGRLAGGVAHDFNNLLTVMLGFTSAAKENLPEGDPGRADLAEVEEAGAKAAALTRQLLAFARRQVTEPRTLDLNAVTLGMEKMLRRLIGEHIELHTRLSDGLWTVLADPGQIEQVIVNLAVNGRDAMPQGGTLQIETSNAVVDPSHPFAMMDVPPGEYVVVSVSDTGHGIAPDAQEHVFEPFFTTKEKGRGTGLGLATCYGIVRQAGGWIWASSGAGRGATFTFCLPRSRQPIEAAALAPAVRPATGTERVLVVEDDDSVRKVAVRTLRKRGYQVTEASNGQEALDIAETLGIDFDLLLTDVVMPVMGGHELAERMLKAHPALKVLFTSGYTEDGIVHQGVLNRDVAFLPKPYDLTVLAEKVRATLDGGR